MNPGPITDWAKTPDGELLLVDELNHRVLIENAENGIRILPGDFRYPRSVAVLGGHAYIVDSWNHRVQVFSLAGWKFQFQFGSFFCPSSIAVMQNMLVVADTNNLRLSFHQPDGSCAFTYALGGYPKRVHIDSTGAIVVHYEDGASETLDY